MPPTDRPRVWNKRQRDVPSDAVYVGRPTKWGNPFTFAAKSNRAMWRVPSREAAIEAFIHFINDDERGWALADAARRELRGKHLVCWCAPAPCHADVLLEIANAD